MIDLAFFKTYINPFYLHLTGGAIVNDPPQVREHIWNEFGKCLPVYTEQTLREMLRDDNWRYQKVAAWAIAAKQVHILLPEVARDLIKFPWHAEHFVICLVSFRGCFRASIA